MANRVSPGACRWQPPPYLDPAHFGHCPAISLEHGDDFPSYLVVGVCSPRYPLPKPKARLARESRLFVQITTRFSPGSSGMKQRKRSHSTPCQPCRPARTSKCEKMYTKNDPSAAAELSCSVSPPGPIEAVRSPHRQFAPPRGRPRESPCHDQGSHTFSHKTLMQA